VYYIPRGTRLASVYFFQHARDMPENGKLN
jgi:hypothetical protein